MQEMQETWVQSSGQEDPLEKEWQPTPVFLLENSIDRGAWRATVQAVAESDMTEYAGSHTHIDRN